MSFPLDNVMPGVAASVLAALGGKGTLTRNTTNYNPTTGTQTPSTQEWPIVVAPPAQYSAYEIANGVALIGDVKLNVQGQGLATDPHPEDIIDIGLAKKLRVVKVDRVMSGLKVVLFECQCRY
jgi:hypothetical protein